MKNIFGCSIFEIMIIVTTLHHSYASLGFSKENMQLTEKALWRAFEFHFHSERGQATPVTPKPPLLYIGHDDLGDKIFRNVKSTVVQNPDGMKLEFQKDTCARCAVKNF